MRDDSDGDDFTQSSCLHPAGVYCTTARQEKRWYRENALGSISGDFLVSIHLIINTSGLEHVCKEPFPGVKGQESFCDKVLVSFFFI